MSVFSGTTLTCIRGDRLVFAELNFNIKSGEILHLKGSNGSGKSTLLRLMAGLCRPSEGIISWDNENIQNDQESFHQNLHYIGHQDGINSALSVRENLNFWSRMRNPKINKNSSKSVLEMFSLNSISDLPTRLLSAGQRKRLNLARICVTEAPLWLLDEPSNSLDSESLNTLNQIILEHQNNGGMTVIATHDALDLDCHSLNIENFHNFSITHQEPW